MKVFRRSVECSLVRRCRDRTVKQDPSSLGQTGKNLLAEVVGDGARLIFRDPRACALQMQLRQALFVEKPSPTKNLHGGTPIPEIDEDDPSLVADVCQIKAHDVSA